MNANVANLAYAERYLREGGRASAAADVCMHVERDIYAIEHEWRRFEQYADCTPFQTFDWLATWHRCVGARRGAEPAIVVGRQGNGELLFILPLAIERTRFARRLVFLGACLCDYNAPLLAPEFPDFVAPGERLAWWRSIQALIEETAGCRYDLVALGKMPEKVGGQANPLFALPTVLNPSGAHLASLAKDWESFYAARRSPSTRRRDRTKRKRLAESGEVRFVTANNPIDLRRTLSDLIGQKRRSFARMGVPDLFSRPGHSEFFFALAAKGGRLVHVSRLDVGSQCAAANFGLVFRRRYYHVLASHDGGPLARFGPGVFHLHEVMRHAIAQGCSQFDFTIGDEPYKRDWADTRLELYDHVAASNWVGQLAAAQIVLRLRALRFVKRSRLLWPLVSRLRSLCGSMKPPVFREVSA